MKLSLNLDPNTIDVNNGIGQIVKAQWKYLPDFGISVAKDDLNADVFVSHIMRPKEWPRVDVLHVHGLYFSDVPHLPYVGWHREANRGIIEASREAVAITVPSNWVATPFRRDMRINPYVIPHGINLGDFSIGKNKGYVLYNKGRESDVCTALPAYQLAERGLPVVSTFMPAKVTKWLKNYRVTGAVLHADMLRLVQAADVYLATTIETFGIGTLEALAYGVPVLGYRWGGTEDIVIHKQNGYLVDPDDINGLEEGYNYIVKNRQRMSEAALESVKKYDWPNIMGTYADLYRGIAEQKPSGDVSVVITNYNYSKWVCEAVDSCLSQTKMPIEVIVVDDGSKDNSREILSGKYGNNPLVKLLFQSNTGVAMARNNGIAKARGEFVVTLDADDRIAPSYIEVVSREMIKDRSLGVAYAGLAFIAEDGSLHAPGWPGEFSWNIQSNYSNPPPTCVPSCSMFRKKMWERAGGFLQRYAPGEDAEFWTRGLSVGFTAKRVTAEPLFLYRGHEGSASRTKKYVPIDGLPWLKDKIFPMGAPVEKGISDVNSYMMPQVSVIVPVGKGHAKHLTTVLDCLLAQTFRQWEVIVIDDTMDEDGNSEFEKVNLTPYPFAKIIHHTGKHGAGIARNIGIDQAKAPLVLFLDADDYLVPDAISKMVAHFIQFDKYIYTDYHLIAPDKYETHEAKEYDQNAWIITDPEAVSKGVVFGMMLHSVTALMPTEWARDLKFDEEMDSWEDWEFFIRAAVKGYCGMRLPEPLLVYQLETGHRRKEVLGKDGKPNEKGSKILSGMRDRYESYITGGKAMSPCCGGSSAAATLLKAKNFVSGDTGGIQMAEGRTTLARMEYTGTNIGAIGFTVNNRTYRGGQDPMSKYADVNPEDVEELLRTTRWKLLRPANNPVVVPVQPTKQEDVSEQQKMEAARRALEKAKAEFANSDQDFQIPTTSVPPVPELIVRDDPVIEKEMSVDDVLKQFEAEEEIALETPKRRGRKK